MQKHWHAEYINSKWIRMNKHIRARLTFDQNLNWRAQLEVLTPGALCKNSSYMFVFHGAVCGVWPPVSVRRKVTGLVFLHALLQRNSNNSTCMVEWRASAYIHIYREYQREQYNCRLSSGGGELRIENFRSKFPWNFTRWLNFSLVKMKHILVSNKLLPITKNCVHREPL